MILLSLLPHPLLLLLESSKEEEEEEEKEAHSSPYPHLNE
jgi:hypothetical protein